MKNFSNVFSIFRIVWVTFFSSQIKKKLQTEQWRNFYGKCRTIASKESVYSNLRKQTFSYTIYDEKFKIISVSLEAAIYNCPFVKKAES